MKLGMRRFIREYLPAYVNGTLGILQRRLLDGWLARDAALQDELSELSSLHSVMHNQPLDAPDPSILVRIRAAAASEPVQPRVSWRPSLVWPLTVTILVLAVILLWRTLPPGLEVSWSLSGPAPESFKVYRASVDSTSSDEFSLIGELPAQTGIAKYDYTDIRLVPGQQFLYQVEAIGDSGNTITSAALVGNALEAFPRQLLFLIILAVIGFAVVKMLRQLKTLLLNPGQFAY